MSLSSKVLQKIVRNEAMASDPPEIYGWRVYMLACSVSLPHEIHHQTGLRALIYFHAVHGC